MTTTKTGKAETKKSTFKHPYIAGRETVLVDQVFSIEMMRDIVDNYHPMNRPRQTFRQQALERDIRNGDYRSDVGNMIKFDRNGNMIDGQKRFYAHLNARVPLKITVQYGLPLDAILFIDRNQPRTVAANVTLAKNINLNRQPTKAEFTADRMDISIATWCLHGLRWNEAGSSSDKLIWTERELMEFVAQNERFIRFVLIDGATTRRPGALGAMAIYAMKNIQEASKFRNALYGFNDNHIYAGSPIQTFREYLKKKSDGGSAPIWDYFNTVRCINAFHAGQNIVGTSLNNGREDFSF